MLYYLLRGIEQLNEHASKSTKQVRNKSELKNPVNYYSYADR